MVRWGWIAWLVFTGFLAVRYLVSSRAALEFVDWGAAAALWALWPIYRGARALWHLMQDAPYIDWNGSYYEFDGRQMRVLFDADAIFVVAADVFDALDVHGHGADASRVRAVAGRDGLVRLPGRREIVFTERGLAAWLERRTDTRSVGFRRWLELEVLAPHRRRRERLA